MPLSECHGTACRFLRSWLTTRTAAFLDAVLLKAPAMEPKDVSRQQLLLLLFEEKERNKRLAADLMRSIKAGRRFRARCQHLEAREWARQQQLTRTQAERDLAMVRS